MEFDQILGNAPLKAFLQTSKNLSHTLLFHGPDGIGKSLFAKALASKLMEENSSRIDSENHPDFYVFYPEITSGNHSIERMRFLIDEVYKPPFEAKRKVFLIHDAHKMLASSANTLLKTLEEPTLDSTIILLSSRKDLLLPTIVSRCLSLAFKPLLEDEIKKILLEKYNIDPEDAARLAFRSEGSIGNALIYSQDLSFQKKSALLFEILQNPEGSILFENAEKIQFLIDEEKKSEAFDLKHIELLCSEILMWYRDKAAFHIGNKLYYPEYRSFFENKTKISFSIQKMIKSFEQVDEALQRNMKFSTCLIDFFLENSFSIQHI